MAKKRRKKKSTGARKSAPRRTPEPARAVARPAAAPGAARQPRGPATGRAAAPGTGGLGWQLLLGLVGLGVLLTGYLTASAWMSTQLPYCGQDSACDLVQSSRWSIFLGIPLTLWGLLTYALLGALVWRARRRPAAWRHALFVACIGVAISYYLTAVSVLSIGATCVYCLASTALMTVICAVLALRKPANLPGFRWRAWLPMTGFVALIVVTGMHLHYSGVFDPSAGPEKPYLKSLAMHLQQSGAKFYGAYWCPRCAEQKAMFEASAHRLPYVECAPGGPNGPRSPSCTTRGIDSYPTWIIDGRPYAGKVEPAELARHAKFRWDEQRALAEK